MTPLMKSMLLVFSASIIAFLGAVFLKLGAGKVTNLHLSFP